MSPGDWVQVGVIVITLVVALAGGLCASGRHVVHEIRTIQNALDEHERQCSDRWEKHLGGDLHHRH